MFAINLYPIYQSHLLKMETLVFGDSITKYQPTVLNDDHLLKIKVKYPVLFGHENGNLIVPPANLRK